MGGCITREPDVDFNSPVDFDHFHILRAIGKGAFGKVCIVKKKDTKEMYAMKYMNKVQIIRKHAVENVFKEVEILRKLEHNFIVNLWFTFQDQEDIFMVLDLMLGGDISYHLEKQGRFPVARVRLYVAELSLALEYLREHRVIHRDVKPANMLLDSGGHVHLTDFNVACVVHSGVPITSITGTKPYMAPEVLRARNSVGYSYAVDWWGMGVSVYEMLRGQRPFTIDRHMTNEEIASNIRRTRPSASVRWDHQTCDLLRMLLHPDESKRLQSVESMRQHRFFQELDWDQVERKEAPPIYVPAQNRIHCDPTHELEEMIVEPNPLHKKHHRLSRRNFRVEDETLMGDLERMERRFSAYNRMKLKEEERTPTELSDEAPGGTQLETSLDSLDKKLENDVHKPAGKVSQSRQTSDEVSADKSPKLGEGVRLNEVAQREEGATTAGGDNSAGKDSSTEGVQQDRKEGEERRGSDREDRDSAIVVSEETPTSDNNNLSGSDRLSSSLATTDAAEATSNRTTAVKTPQYVRIHPAEGDLTPPATTTTTTQSSVESPPCSPPSGPPSQVERTDSMSSGALLLPREL